MKLLVCCDATSSGGLGHFFRCVALAEEALGRGWEVVVAGQLEVPLARDICARLGIGIVAVELSDAEEVRTVAVSIAAEIVHVDSYRAADDLLEVLDGTGILLSSLEDGRFGRRASHLVIDPSPEADRTHRPADGSGMLLLGLRFVPLRSSIRNSPGWRGRNQPPRLLVIMGGTDARSVSEHIAEHISRSLPGVEVHVVLAGDRKLLPDRPSGVVTHPASDDVTDLLTGSDVVVAGAGTTIWELCHLGVPMTIVRLVANQEENYRFALGSDVAAGLGRLDDAGDLSGLRFEGLRLLLSDQRGLQAMSEHARRLVDGGGVSRILDALSRSFPPRSGMSIRPAEHGDASSLFDWRNDSDAREASRSADELDWDDHLSWLSRRIADPDTVLLVAAIDGRPAGQVRFDRRGAGRWEISIAVGASMRGRGVGPWMLTRAESLLAESHRPVDVVAVVAATNSISVRLFERAGYRRSDSPGDRGWISLEKALP